MHFLVHSFIALTPESCGVRLCVRTFKFKFKQGQQFQKCTLTTALLFPGIAFSIFFIIDIILAFVYNSTEAVPFRTIIELLVSESLPGLPLPANVSCPSFAFMNLSCSFLLFLCTIQLLWLAVSLPLVFCGTYFGYNKPEIEFPGQPINV